LVINKTDLAPYVDVDLTLMEQDVKENRKNKPYVFICNKEKESLLKIKEWILALIDN